MGGQRPWAASDVTNVYNVRDKSVDHERLILLTPATPLLAAALLTPPCASPWTAGVQRCRPLDWTGLFAAHAGRPELDVRPRRRRGRALCVPGLRSVGINQNVGGTVAQCVKSKVSSCGVCTLAAWMHLSHSSGGAACSGALRFNSFSCDSRLRFCVTASIQSKRKGF